MQEMVGLKKKVFRNHSEFLLPSAQLIAYINRHDPKETTHFPHLIATDHC